MKKPLFLIIDDEESIRSTFRLFLENEGYAVATAATYDEGLHELSQRTPDVIITDIILGANSGVDLLRTLKERKVEAPVVMVTGAPTLDTAIESLRLGAFDYISKPVRKSNLLEVSFRALRHGQLLEERKRLAEERERMRVQLQALFESVGEGLLLVDGGLVVREINRAALSFLNAQHTETVGHPLAELAPRLVESFGDELHAVLSKASANAQSTLEDPFGRGAREIFHVRVSPVLPGLDAAPGAVVVVRDITRLHSLEAHLIETAKLHNLIGKSKAMQEVYRLVDALKDTDTTVLIQGESGTGKELVAAALHYQGPRVKGPFIPVNCTALNEQLLESELFGHVKGAFTGAVANKIGRFEAAEGGTIFLDEIGDISANLQVKLLRVLQERSIERVGENQTRKVNVRVITATNCDMDEKVARGEFREDLFYRLNVVRVFMPPLRKKKEDLPLLIEHFRQKLIARIKKPIEGFTEEAMKALILYDWPGNVRELENAVEHAFIMSRGPLVDVEHLPKSVLGPPKDVVQSNGAINPFFHERDELIMALEKSGGNRAKAARLLGVNRTTLYRRMERWGIKSPIS